jgi:hypothetical protein
VTTVLVLRERGKSVVGRCGESRGSHRPFIGAGERQRGVAGGSNGGVNGFNTIDGGEVKRGIKGGGGVGRHLRVELGGAGWPEATRRSGNSRPAWGRGWS